MMTFSDVFFMLSSCQMQFSDNVISIEFEIRFKCDFQFAYIAEGDKLKSQKEKTLEEER